MKTIHVLRLAAVNTIGFSASTVMPLWLGGISAEFGMPAWFAGLAVVTQLGVAAAFNLLTPTLFPKTPLLPLARAAMAVACAGYLLALFGNPVLFLVGACLTGAALGTALNVINRLMGSIEHVQHGYALFVLMEVGVATVLFLVGAALIDRFGLLAIFAEVAVAAALGIVLLIRLPVGATNAASPASPALAATASNTRAGAFGLAAFALFFIGQATINAFMPVIGQATGLTSNAANQAIGLGMPFGFLGGMLARFVGERVRPAIPVIGVIIILACVAPALTLDPAASVFRVGVVVLACATMFVVPYFFAQLGAFDRAGRFTGFGPAMMLTGLAVGPGIAVFLNDRFGIGAIGVFASAMLVLAGLLFLLAVRQGAAAPQTATL